MKRKFDDLSIACSKKTTLAYSTSFSLGIRFLDVEFHKPIYSIYGFVRFADEIVDSFHDYNKELLLDTFEKDTYDAISQRISLNPILNSFQKVVHDFNIDLELIDCFLQSMRTDLHTKTHSKESIKDYILGSAEVVGLMCLKVFTKGNSKLYDELKPAAMKLGSAFQKVNFLRDAQADFKDLDRNYFPQFQGGVFTSRIKNEIEQDIEADFREALTGIRKLPAGARGGVYLAYFYYTRLFKKIKRTTAETVLSGRIRINNVNKLFFMLNSYLRHQFNLL
ncbi:MAG: phytoene/squalene synthase family protein [Candidatus Dadabacteria bacterium]